MFCFVDVGLLIAWLIWFFRLRDDGPEFPDDGDGGGGGGDTPCPRPRKRWAGPIVTSRSPASPIRFVPA